MSAWSEDKLGLGLVVTPVLLAVAQAAGLALGSDLGVMTIWVAPLLTLLVTYVLAGMDASRRGQTASILVLMVWAIGYPLHMRTRSRYPGSYFGLGSALLVMGLWLTLLVVANKVATGLQFRG
jgi:hypothetical protein